MPNTGLHGKAQIIAPYRGSGGWLGSAWNDRYLWTLFVPVQDALDRSFAGLISGMLPPAEAGYVQPFPAPDYVNDSFAQAISLLLPLIMVVSWIYSVSLTVKAVVYEKELRLKEAMKMMGLSSWIHWTGSFITAATIVSSSAVVVTGLLSGGAIFPQSDPLLVFTLIELFAVSSVTFSFLVSTFFSKAKVASACSGIIYFTAYLPYIFLNRNESTLTKPEKFVMCLLSPTAFAVGCELLSNLEIAGPGLTWTTLKQYPGECSNFSVLDVFGMLLFDTLLYLLLSLYIEAVWPGEYGVGRPYLFFLDWCRNGRKLSDNRPLVCSTQSDCSGAGLVIAGVSKQYTDSFGRPGPKALKSVRFSCAESHVTALLGHNGAGKTTLMSVITGLFPPSDGDVLVAGISVRTNPAEVHSRIGLCPQYNVLWDKLTVDEHLTFSAGLHGVSRVDADAEIRDLLRALNLTDKQHTLASALSGGMKRKLSIAMAYTGGPQCVILDEPTAGMDPGARRLTWDLILKNRAKRATLLSTHHMDEADLLSDKIVFISDGTIRAVGTPVGLKQRYGAGYTLVFHLSSAANRADISAFISSRVPNAKKHDDSVHGISFILPLSSRHRFESLFVEVDLNGPRLGILSYGVNATSLEEVFLAVTEQATQDCRSSIQGGGISTNSSKSAAVTARLQGAQRGRPSNTPTPTACVGINSDHQVSYDGMDETADSAPLLPRSPGDTLLLDRPDRYRQACCFLLVHFLRQCRAVVLKRVHSARRDPRTVCAQVVLPVVFVCLAMAVATFFPSEKDQTALVLNPANISFGCGSEAFADTIPYANYQQDATSASMLASVLSVIPAAVWVGIPASTGSMTNYLLDHLHDAAIHGAVTFDQDGTCDVCGSNTNTTSQALVSTRQTVRAWYHPLYYHAAPSFVNAVNNGLLRSTLSRAQIEDVPHNTSIMAMSHPLPLKLGSALRDEARFTSDTDVTVAIFVIIAFSFVSASSLVFLVTERVSLNLIR